jgi:hypothetical protein
MRPTLPVEQSQSPADFAVLLNEKLLNVGANRAEHGFGVGLGRTLLPLVVLVIFAYVLGVHSWIALVLVGLAGLFISVAFAAYVASQARAAAMRRLYQDEIDAEIGAYLKDNSLDYTQFYLAAQSALPSGAPLLRFLAAPQPELSPEQE